MMSIIDSSDHDGYHDNMKVDRQTMVARRTGIFTGTGPWILQRGIARVTVLGTAREAELKHGVFQGPFTGKRAQAAGSYRPLFNGIAGRWISRPETAALAKQAIRQGF